MTDVNTKPMSFAAAIRSFFGLKPGQTAGDFLAETKALNEAERSYFRNSLTKIVYNITN